MKTIYKIILYISLVMILTTSIFAVDISESAVNTAGYRENGSIARTEEYEWHYKTINGVKEALI